MATLEMTYREALQKSMFEEMDKNPDVFLMGEDIGRYEGTFKVTKGFFPKYGTRRVVDTPITEAGFTGLATGAAMAGLRPIVEFMTMSFSILALDQIINHTAKIQTKQPSTSTPMPNLSHRIAAASKDSVNSMRRIAVAQKKVTDALLDGLRPDESEGRETQRPCKNVTPPKTNQPRR